MSGGVLVLANQFEDALFQALDKYYSEWHHFLEPEQIEQWFKDVGIDQIERSDTGRQYTAVIPK
jgi:hypothetical protein|tara:strand:- start:251 stop:442 length:192 start_codon:yes stop_codon:yes gene_type:complete